MWPPECRLPACLPQQETGEPSLGKVGSLHEKKTPSPEVEVPPPTVTTEYPEVEVLPTITTECPEVEVPPTVTTEYTEVEVLPPTVTTKYPAVKPTH